MSTIYSYHIYPHAGSSYNLGSAANDWAKLFVDYIYSQTSMRIYTSARTDDYIEILSDGGSIGFYAKGAQFIIDSDSNIIRPQGDKVEDLGTSANSFDTIYNDGVPAGGLLDFSNHPDYKNGKILDIRRDLNSQKDANLSMAKDINSGARHPTKSEFDLAGVYSSEINPAYLPLEVTDYYSLIESWGQCMNYTENDDKFCGENHLNPITTQPIDYAVEIGALSSFNYESINQLLNYVDEIKAENDLLKSELCKKDNTYAWCKGGEIGS